MDVILSRKIINFVEVMHRKKKVTGRDYKGTPRESFWLMSRYLRDNGIITVDGVNERNERVWILTEKGRKFAELAIQVRNVIDKDQALRKLPSSEGR